MTDFDELKQIKAQCLRDITEALPDYVNRLKEGYIVDLGPLGTLYPSVTGPWKQDADELALTDMTPKATYQPSDEINQAIKGATLSWATEKDEKEGTETPAGGDDNGGDDNGGGNNPPGELEG